MTTEEYTFLGPDPEVGYYRYRDLSTGSMLVGRPGYTCPIAAVDVGAPDEDGNPTELPVPPDCRWLPSGDADAKAAAQVAKDAEAAAGAQVPKDAAKGGRKPKGDTGAPAGASPEGGE